MCALQRGYFFSDELCSTAVIPVEKHEYPMNTNMFIRMIGEKSHFL